MPLLDFKQENYKSSSELPSITGPVRSDLFTLHVLVVTKLIKATKLD
jgi:hypothetical protein